MPRNVRARDLGGGAALIAWDEPLTDDAHGDPAEDYVVYQSANGYGFGDPVIVEDGLSVTISDIPAGETRYFRVAAINQGGESMPSEVLAVRSPTRDEDPNILIVNGFDRLRRQINPIQTFTHPPEYEGQSIERQMWRRSNSFDYVVQHAEALAANGYSFDSCSNEAIIESYVDLNDYKVVVWILGTESSEDVTFTNAEQNKINDFLPDGRGLFVTGSEVAYDLIGQGHGASFARNTLGVDYAGDDAQTFQATGTPGGILSGVGAFDFDPAYGAPYEVYSPDVLEAETEAQACLNYVGGTGGVAGVEYAAGTYRVVTFGFPFETISSEAKRIEVMGLVIDFLKWAPPPPPFDYDLNGKVEFYDFQIFTWCFQGPEAYYEPTHFCVDVEGEEDEDIDLEDFSVLQRWYGYGWAW
jgi:hypothetical protein